MWNLDPHFSWFLLLQVRNERASLLRVGGSHRAKVASDERKEDNTNDIPRLASYSLSRI